MSGTNDVNNKVVATIEDLISDAFYRFLGLAVMGRGKFQGARAIASSQPGQHNDQEDAIRWLSNQHIALAGGQGFATNWSGFLLPLVAIPANTATAALVQARAIVVIAHPRGYELSDPQVHTAILTVVFGLRGSAALIASGDLPSSTAAVVTTPTFGPQLDSRISRVFLERSMNQADGKRLRAFLAKKILLVGDGIGAIVGD